MFSLKKEKKRKKRVDHVALAKTATNQQLVIANYYVLIKIPSHNYIMTLKSCTRVLTTWTPAWLPS